MLFKAYFEAIHLHFLKDYIFLEGWDLVKAPWLLFFFLKKYVFGGPDIYILMIAWLLYFKSHIS